MRIDLYTKGVLTAIASCLIYLSLGLPPVFQTAQAQAPAQAVPQIPVQPLPQNPSSEPRVVAVPQVPPPGRFLTGDDVGFRVERIGNGVVDGTLMVRISDQWMNIRLTGRVMPLTH
jgi:hypothetical protein